jgi:hypothetical protein
VAAAAAMLAVTACANPLGRQYEYEEQVYLSVDGSATVIVDASIPALVALRGLALDPSPTARTDQEEIRRVIEAEGCDVARVGQPWRRNGRRFVQVRIATTDVNTLGSCGLLAWSTYSFTREAGGNLFYEQQVGAPAAGNPGPVKWTGDELVGFKVHVPSRILFHNVRRLDDGQAGGIDRGNILTWEQRLTDRRAGTPMDLKIRMEPQSILYQTLWLFAGAFAAAVAVLAIIVWLTVRRGRRAVKRGTAA